MKKLLLLALAACIPFGMAMAQDPANFHIVYGNSDGSVLSVGSDRDIDIQVWGATDPTPGNPDSVTFMHVPLMSDDNIITSRNGGFFPPPPGPGHWDDISFLGVNNNGNDPLIPVGFSSQSILGFAYLNEPRDPQDFVYTLGAFQLLANFRMHTSADPALIGTTVCPFGLGHNPANGGLLWGMQDGVRGVTPTQTYGCLFFSPNADPVWTVFPASATGDAGIAFSFHLEGTDTDVLNNLHIALVSGPGAFTETTGGPGGLAAGDWTGTLAAGSYTLGFVLDDGTVQVPLSVPVTVSAIGLEIGCVDYFPGAVATVPIFLHTASLLTGGFEILIHADPTALNLISVAWTARINNGNEYHNWVQDPINPGSDRFVWIANINNGIYTPPAAAGDDAILLLSYQVSSSLPWGMSIPIEYMITDYTDNTISNETGYEFIHPLLTNGCVNTVNPLDFKGDPNMNCFGYEVADAVLVARRLIEGYIVWSEDAAMDNIAPCTRHSATNDPVQEASGDLNNNTFVDIADLVRFINILNGFIMPPKLDPVSGVATVTVNNGSVNINSGIEVGGVLVRMSHNSEVSTPVAANGMDIMTQDVNGVLSVLIYSMEGNRIPAGNQTLFTLSGDVTITEVSAADAYGRLLETAKGETLPTEYSVAQNYPNPFNNKTLISFALPTASDVTVNIYNVTGQLVQTLGGHFEAGVQSVVWEANVSSGVYFYKVSAGDFSQTMKMTLLK